MDGTFFTFQLSFSHEKTPPCWADDFWTHGCYCCFLRFIVGTPRTSDRIFRSSDLTGGWCWIGTVTRMALEIRELQRVGVYIYSVWYNHIHMYVFIVHIVAYTNKHACMHTLYIGLRYITLRYITLHYMWNPTPGTCTTDSRGFRCKWIFLRVEG